MKISKLLALALAVVMIVGVLAGCQSDKDVQLNSDNASVADNSWDTIKEKGKFIVGLDDAFPPMGFRDENNEIVGFDIDMAKAVAQELGLEVEFKPINWDNKQLELDGGNVDLLWNGYSVTPERQETNTLSDPYLANRQIIVTLKGSEVTDKASLKGKKIALQGGSSAEDAVKKDEATYNSIGDSNIMRFKDNNTVMMELESGRVDAAVLDEVVCRYYISKKPDNFPILEESFDEEVYAVGARKADKAFMTEINNALNTLKENGKAAEISVKWFGSDNIK